MISKMSFVSQHFHRESQMNTSMQTLLPRNIRTQVRPHFSTIMPPLPTSAHYFIIASTHYCHHYQLHNTISVVNPPTPNAICALFPPQPATLPLPLWPNGRRSRSRP